MSFLLKVKKYKPFSFLRTLCRNHILVYSLVQFSIIKKDRVGLELLRECTQKRIYDRLRKKYKKILVNYKADTKAQKAAERIIWVCWLQGFQRAPQLVQKCLASVKKFSSGYEVIEITRENFMNYVDIPSFIIEKWEKGIITNTHFSDILRIYLLSRNGGIWIDSTVLLTGEIPLDIKNADFFVFQKLKPGRDGASLFVSSWFMSSCKSNPIIQLTKELLETYWRKENSLCDYFLLHYFACNELQTVYQDIPQYTNSTPHILFFNLYKPFDLDIYNSICSQTSIHKLSYKNIKSFEDVNTFYDFIIGD